VSVRQNRRDGVRRGGKNNVWPGQKAGWNGNYRPGKKPVRYGNGDGRSGWTCREGKVAGRSPDRPAPAFRTLACLLLSRAQGDWQAGKTEDGRSQDGRSTARLFLSAYRSDRSRMAESRKVHPGDGDSPHRVGDGGAREKLARGGSLVTPVDNFLPPDESCVAWHHEAWQACQRGQDIGSAWRRHVPLEILTKACAAG
jgi:hypothetical protein